MTLVDDRDELQQPGHPERRPVRRHRAGHDERGLPLDGIGLLIAADSIPDVFATVVNVTGDMGVAAMVADTTHVV